MNKLTKSLTLFMQPETALIAYTCEDEYNHREYFLEMRRIGKNGLMGAGKPVSFQFVQNLAESFTVEASSTPHGVLPKGMLYADTHKGSEKYAWHTPPCKKYLYFKDSLTIPNGGVLSSRTCGGWWRIIPYIFTRIRQSG